MNSIKQIVTIGILASYLVAMVSAQYIQLDENTPISTYKIPISTYQIPISTQQIPTQQTNFPKIQNLDQCVANLTTSCLFNQTTICMYVPYQDVTVCQLITIYGTKVDNGKNQYINTYNKSHSAQEVWAGNQTLNFTSIVRNSGCQTVAKSNKLSCSTTQTTCVNIFSPDVVCSTKTSGTNPVASKTVIPTKAQSDKCVQANKTTTAAQKNKDSLCGKLNDPSSSSDFKKFKKDCVSATSQWYTESQKSAQACYTKAPAS